MALFRRGRNTGDIERLMSIEGQLSRAEVEQLFELSKNVPFGAVIVEIGSYRGRSAITLALGAASRNNNIVYAVDPHIAFRGVFGAEFGPDDQAQMYRNLSTFLVGHRVCVVSLPSVNAARAWTEANIGLLWIDGDHTEEAVRNDLVAWYPYVLSGGVVAFHDNHGEGVKSVIGISQNTKKLVFQGEVDTLSWLSKP